MMQYSPILLIQLKLPSVHLIPTTVIRNTLDTDTATSICRCQYQSNTLLISIQSIGWSHLSSAVATLCAYIPIYALGGEST